MPAEAYNKVDIVTWLINVGHMWQEETEDHWANPSQHPFMRQVLHESVHFWQAIGLPYYLRVSFGAYRDFQQVRANAFSQGQDNSPVPADQLQLEPNRTYFLDYQRIARRYGELSGADLIEGLARYWDIHLCGIRHAIEDLVAAGKLSQQEVEEAQLQYGPFFLPDGMNYTDAALRFVFDRETRYNRAYKFAVDAVGNEAFILFPVLGFLALSSRQSVSHFQEWVKLYADARPFAIQRGNFLEVWTKCFAEAFKWIVQGLQQPVYSSLTVYNRLRSRFLSWSMSSPLAQRFGLMTGHGILDHYLQNYWQLMRAENPSLPNNDVELRMSPIFCLPGVPTYRDTLLKGFHPPTILFADGKAWLDTVNWGQQSLKLEDDLISMGAMIGAAMALSGEFDKDFFAVTCPHVACPWHSTLLCWKVPRFPDKTEECVMPGLYRTQMNLVLPDNRDWNAGQVDRPIVKEHEQLLSLELD